MVRKARARGGALQAIPENAQTVSATTDAKAGVDVRQIIESIEGQSKGHLSLFLSPVMTCRIIANSQLSIAVAVEDRIATIMSAAEDAIVNLKNDLKTRLVRLTKAVRLLPSMHYFAWPGIRLLSHRVLSLYCRHEICH